MWAFRLAATTASAAILMMGYQVLRVHRSRLHRAAAKTIEPVESPDETGPRFVVTVRTGFEDDVDHQAAATQGPPTGTASIHGTILGLETDAGELSLGAQTAGRHYAAAVTGMAISSFTCRPPITPSWLKLRPKSRCSMSSI
jgi:hypothetical protein